ncbi:MAG: hypothetical protein HKM24_00310 [Gammaproteobacteria bacterium]|nr:hypothetical protein [Gammaproteobacteria bacterium]
MIETEWMDKDVPHRVMVLHNNTFWRRDVHELKAWSFDGDANVTEVLMMAYGIDIIPQKLSERTQRLLGFFDRDANAGIRKAAGYMHEHEGSMAPVYGLDKGPRIMRIDETGVVTALGKDAEYLLAHQDKIGSSRAKKPLTSRLLKRTKPPLRMLKPVHSETAPSAVDKDAQDSVAPAGYADFPSVPTAVLRKALRAGKTDRLEIVIGVQGYLGEDRCWFRIDRQGQGFTPVVIVFQVTDWYGNAHLRGVMMYQLAGDRRVVVASNAVGRDRCYQPEFKRFSMDSLGEEQDS